MRRIQRPLLVIWIVTFTVIVFFSIAQLNRDKADVNQLKSTNCALRQFLLTARDTRLRVATTEFGLRRKADLIAVSNYDKLIAIFNSGHCHLKVKLNP